MQTDNLIHWLGCTHGGNIRTVATEIGDITCRICRNKFMESCGRFGITTHADNTMVNPDSNYHKYAITDHGVTVAVVFGPMSLTATLAACEKLNGGFEWNGWVSRATKYLNTKTPAEAALTLADNEQ